MLPLLMEKRGHPIILCVSQFNHENAVDVGKTVPGPHFSQPYPVREKIPCQLMAKNDSSWLQEDTSWRRQTSHDGKQTAFVKTTARHTSLSHTLEIKNHLTGCALQVLLRADGEFLSLQSVSSGSASHFVCLINQEVYK